MFGCSSIIVQVLSVHVDWQTVLSTARISRLDNAVAS